MTDPPAPAPAPPAPGAVARIRRTLRAAIRQLAAAVYVFVAFGLLWRFVAFSVVGTYALEIVLAFAGGAILTLAVEGSLLETGLVGVLFAFFELAAGWLNASGEAELGDWLLSQAAPLGGVAVAGLLGAVVVRRRRAKKARTPGEHGAA